jgi:hypothetical protein
MAVPQEMVVKVARSELEQRFVEVPSPWRPEGSVADSADFSSHASEKAPEPAQPPQPAANDEAGTAAGDASLAAFAASAYEPVNAVRPRVATVLPACSHARTRRVLPRGCGPCTE